MSLRSGDVKRVLEARESARAPASAAAGGTGECDLVYVLFEESHQCPNAPLAEQLLDFAVATCQPSPELAHCELLIPPSNKHESRVLFCTYLGTTSSWSEDQKDNVYFYLKETRNRWRAVPVFHPGAAAAVRAEADCEVGVSYSLARYLTALRPLRWASWFLSTERRAPAHCATLAARVLGNAIGATAHNCNYYGPSSLYRELSDRAAQVAPGLPTAPPNCARAAEKLLRAPIVGSTVASMGDCACQEAVRALTLQAVRDLASADRAAQRTSQKRLADGLLRWVVLRES